MLAACLLLVQQSAAIVDLNPLIPYGPTWQPPVSDWLLSRDPSVIPPSDRLAWSKIGKTTANSRTEGHWFEATAKREDRQETQIMTSRVAADQRRRGHDPAANLRVGSCCELNFVAQTCPPPLGSHVRFNPVRVTPQAQRFTPSWKGGTTTLSMPLARPCPLHWQPSACLARV